MTNTYSPNNTVLKLKEKNDKIEKRNISTIKVGECMPSPSNGQNEQTRYSVKKKKI